jgi:predicted PurR-regulated permease PerM
MADSSIQVTLSPKTLVMILGLLLLLWLLVTLWQVVLLLLLAGLVAAGLYPVVRWLNVRKDWPRTLSILVTYLAIIGVFGLMVLVVSNVVVEQGPAFVQLLPQVVGAVVTRIETLPWLADQPQLYQALSNVVQGAIRQSAQLLEQIFTYLVAAFRGLISVVTVLVLAFFLLAHGPHFRDLLLLMVPVQERGRLSAVVSEVTHRTGAYVRGQLTLMAAVGLLTWLGLALLGVEYSFILGLIAFFLEIVPIIGPVLAGVIAFLVALAQDPALAVWTVVLAIVIQQLESYWMAPVILGRFVHLNAFWILLSILALGNLFGLVGVLLAVPTAVTVSILVQTYYLNRAPSET